MLVALAAVSPSDAEAGPISPGPEWKLIFAEEFCCKGPMKPLTEADGGPSDQSDGGLDLSTWTMEEGYNNGWGNGEPNKYTVKYVGTSEVFFKIK